jgi:hypothetical protein
MDISKTVQPRSDQLNFDDVAVSTLTMTVSEARKGSAEQPVELHSDEFPGRPYKPGKSMRRILIAAWGSEASAYVGRTITLYGDPTIRFGKDEVGGIRIKALSDIDKPLTVALTITRGKRAPFTVQPLDAAPKPKDTSGRDWLKELAQTEGDVDLIKSLGAAASAAHAGDPVLSIIRDEYKRVVALTVAEPSE